jgi:nucleotide-binding universal stress UspA family protein
MNTILLATDGSPSARQATAFAIQLARATGWALDVVTTWTLPATVFGDVPEHTWQQLVAKERKRAKSLVNETIDAARARGVEARGTAVRGDPITEICAAAESASLLVVGAHGWGALKRVVFGSVSGSLLHDAPCPVLVVREDVPAPEERAEVAESVGVV